MPKIIKRPGTQFIGESRDLDIIHQALCVAIRLGVHTCIRHLTNLYNAILKSPEQQQLRASARRLGIPTIPERHVEFPQYKPNRKLHG